MRENSNAFDIALCQFAVSGDKEKNIEKMAAFVEVAAGRGAGAKFVSLPEMWNCPYTHKHFADFSESEDGVSVSEMSRLAKKYGVYLVGGSIPERGGGKIYNSCFVFNPSGDLIAKHRKVHLFDVHIKGRSGHRFFESETLAAGDSLTVFDSPFGKIGVAICYDIRFHKMFSEMSDLGAQLIFLPAAFNMTTGPAHWELLCRSRALDNQIYFAANGQGRDLASPFVAYGHSMVVNPWGEICGKLDHGEAVLTSSVSFEYLENVRGELPIREG